MHNPFISSGGEYITAAVPIFNTGWDMRKPLKVIIPTGQGSSETRKSCLVGGGELED